MRKSYKWLVIISVLLVSMYYLKTRIQKTGYQTTFVTIETEQEPQSAFQVYFNTGRGYNQDQLVSGIPLDKSGCRLIFFLPNSKIKNFRIDPGSVPGTIRIKKVCIKLGSDLKCLYGNALADNFKARNGIGSMSLENNNLVIQANSDDPYMEYTGEAIKDFTFTLETHRIIWLAVITILINIILILFVLKFEVMWQKILNPVKKYILSLTFEAHTMFFVAALIWGTSTVFITPPFQVPDENAHFFRAYQVSRAGFMPVIQNNGIGGYIPDGLIKVVIFYCTRHSFPNQKIDRSVVEEAMEIPLNNENKSFMTFPNSCYNTPTLYLPQALALMLGTYFNISPFFQIYLGRLFNLLFWIVLATIAIRIAPVFKWLMALVALLPMSVYQAASLSPDASMNAVSMLLFGFILYLAYDENKKLDRNSIILFAIMAIFLTLSRYAYVSIALLFFLIPVSKSSSVKAYYLTAFLLLGVIALTFVTGSLIVTHIYSSVHPDVKYYGK